MKPFLVLDANAFIHISDFSKLDEIYQFYSTLDALSEVKDYNARERLRTFPYKINQRSASDSSVKLIRRFAQETGDLASLSNVDIDLIALAYTLIEENGKVSLIRPHPPKPIEFNKIKNKFSEVKNQQVVEEVVEQDEDNQQQEVEDDDDGWMEVAPKNKVLQAVQNPEKVEDVEQDNQDSSSSDESQWITRENMFEQANGCGTSDSREEIMKIQAAVMTADYAMQNVLLQIGIPNLSFDGLRIQNARRHVLECYVCKIVYRDPSKVFCSSCGNDTLLKVSCSVNSDGTLILFRKKGFKINKRGNQYNIPSDLKLKNGLPFIMTEDQLLQRSVQQKLKRQVLSVNQNDQQKQNDYQFNKMMANYNNGIGFDDIDYKQKKTVQKIQVGFGRLNPNDPKDMRKIKKQL